ncbi:MAG TPA: pitrilysin family protein [Vicinamibacteria bacterium]|nr:pitrilysin family protein [Vicinamibacteria bacterium]
MKSMTTRALTIALVALAATTPLARAAEKKALPQDLPPFGADRPLPVPAIAQSKLPNGLAVWLVKRTGFPRAAVVLALRGAGSAADPKGKDGLTGLLAAAVKEGTTTRTSRALAEELQTVGAEIDASGTADALFVSTGGLGSGVPKMLEVMADVVRNASYPAAEVELAKQNALQDLMAQEATPEFQARKTLARAVYGDHPYHVVAPRKETLQATTPAELKQEHARRFHPERALLVVVGDFDAAAVQKALTRYFGPWRGTGEAPAETPSSPAAATTRRLIVTPRAGSVQSQIVIGRLSATVTDPEYYPLLVANTICSGSFGSRLTENIREDKGYTYSPGGGIATRAKGGLLTVRADVRTEVTAAALTEMFYEQDRMASTMPTEEEMSRAKRYQGGLYLLRNQIQGAVAQTLASNWVNGLPPEALGEFVSKVNAVTPDQVREAGRAFFPSARQTVVVVGDEAKVKAELAQFGEVTVVQP